VNPPEFVAKWGGSTRSERAASQEHFIDLRNMLGVPTPNEDPTGEEYDGLASHARAFTPGSCATSREDSPPSRSPFQGDLLLEAGLEDIFDEATGELFEDILT